MVIDLRSWRVGYAVVGGVLLSCGIGRAQDLFVHARTGCDANPGTAPGAPLQTITRALQIAATPPIVPRTIRVAGAFGSGARVPYDDEENPFSPGCATPAPQGIETLPLVMLGTVSVAWEVPISDDTDPGPAFVPARPLIRSRIPLTATLLSFGGGYSPGASPVNLTSFDFEWGNPSALLIPGGTQGTVSPTLRDLRVFDSQVGVLVTAAGAGQKVSPTLVDGEFAHRVGAPAAGTALLRVQASGGGEAIPMVQNCSFRAEPPQFAISAVSLEATADGLIDATVRNCFFDAGDLLTPAGQGLERAIRMTTAVGGGASSAVKALITGSTFEHSVFDAVLFQTNASAVTNAATSNIALSGNLFRENNRTDTAAPGINNGGEVTIEVDAGNRAIALISGNTFVGSGTRGRSAIFVGNPNPGGFGASAGTASVTIEQNAINQPFWHGVFLHADSLDITGSVARNIILDPGGHGIFNLATSGYYSSTTRPDLVNNIVGYAGANTSGFLGDGIRNEVMLGSFATNPFAATPRIVHTTVSNPTGFALNNVFPPAYPQAFSVTNSIFRFSGAGFDIVDGTAGTYPFPNLTVSYSDFFLPTPAGLNNTADLPSFVSPTARNFHLATGSLLVDRATNTPPVVPAVDIDGNNRRIDVGPPGPPGTIADMGADERTTP